MDRGISIRDRLDRGLLLDRWGYREEGRRDLRLDLLRGYAVFAMICDHVSGISWISPFTGGNRFVVSAAEGFVFLAGLVIGMVYGRRIHEKGWLEGAESILRRAVVLYAVTVGLTLLFVALFQFTTLKLWLDRSYGLGLSDPVELVVGTLTLHYTYHGTDILWMYTILIAASPLVFLLMEMKRTRAVLAGSWLLWLAYQFFPNQAAIPWVATNVNYFPVAAWQVIFVTGLAMGYHRERVFGVLGRIPTHLALILFTLGLLFLITIHRAHDTGRLAGWPILGRLAGELYLDLFDKPSLAIGRLVAFVILAGFAYSLVTVFWAPVRRALGWLLLPLGTSSLRAYGIHLLLIVVVYNIDVLARLYDRSRTGNTILQLVTVGLTLAIVVAWKRLEAGVEWRLPAPAWPTRLEWRRASIAAASALVLFVTVAAAASFGTLRSSRPVDLAAATAEADVLRYIPHEAAGPKPLTILLVLHGEGQKGPEFARPLIDVARANAWAMIAPTVPYGDWTDPQQVAADAIHALPRLRDLLEGLDEHVAAELRPRVLILGAGRGAHTAHQFALFYPDNVGAVATIGPAPCILPADELQTASNEDIPLPFPFGVEDVGQYVGEEYDEQALRGAAFWIGVTRHGDNPIGECPWGPLANRDPTARGQIFAELLARIGSRTQVVALGEGLSDDAALSQALAFLQTHDPKTAAAVRSDER